MCKQPFSLLFILREQAVEHALETISRDDWVLLRNTFRWPYYREATRAIALSLLDNHREHHEDDVIWALTQLRRGDDSEHAAIVRSLVSTSNNTDVIRAALAAYQSTDAEMAWNDLQPLLKPRTVRSNPLQEATHFVVRQFLEDASHPNVHVLTVRKPSDKLQF